MITGPQIREARRLLGWPAYRLAQRCKVTAITMAKAEHDETQAKVAEGTLDRIEAVLESAGIEFTNGGQPGVRMRGTGT